MKLPGSACPPALRISMIYLAVSACWIVLSDRVLEWLRPADADLTQLQSMKGLGFVAITAAMLYVLIKHSDRARDAALRKLQTAKLVVESSPVVLWRWRAEPGWPVEYVSENVAQYGYSASDFMAGKISFSAIVHPDDLARITQTIVAQTALGSSHYTQQYRIRCKDGGVRWLDDRTTVGRDDAGNITWFQGITNDITEQRLAEEKILFNAECTSALLQLMLRAPVISEQELLRFALEQAERLTRSHIAYIHFINDDQATIQLGIWSANTLKTCAAAHDDHYPIEHAGVWADSVRLRQPLIHNDYASLQHRKGLPDGHAQLIRHMGVPVLQHDQVCMVIGVGNKEACYDDNDLKQLELIANNLWALLQRKRVEQQLELHAEVFRTSKEGIMITDSEKRILSVNQAFSAITGFSEAEALGQTPRLLKSGKHELDFYRTMWEAITTQGSWSGEIWNRRKDGEIHPVWLTITAVTDGTGKATHYIDVFTDLSAHKQMEERITQLTRYDMVTGLPNMFFFDDLLSMAIIEATHAQHGIAVMRLDIENFHAIDDNFGFEVGDNVLKIIADRLVEAAGGESLITRLAKDNFTIAYPRVRDVSQATLLAEKLQKTVAQAIKADKFEIHPSVKLGVSFFPSDGDNARDLVQKAGIALNRAKLDKVNGLRFFTQGMNDMLLAKAALTNDMRHAIERDEFELYYQPVVEMASGRIVGMEALVRWNHPVNGFLLPNKFIALAEESGLIQPLGNWILRRAFHQMKEWRDAGCDSELMIAVNASALQLESTELIEVLENLLAETGLPSSCIELELTESSLMSDIGQTHLMLRKFKDLGIQLSIDDFGTGYSSLAYLKQFSVDKLKIDKSFIDNLASNANNAVIVQATITMSHSLGLKVIAEGVETQAQAGYLRSMLCDQYQGYLFSPPVPAKAMLALLRGKPDEQAAPAGCSQRTLLLVDDEPNMLSSLKRTLRRDGYQVLTANSGAEAFDLLARNPVGVIVSDQRMPGMTGTELLSQVKMMYPQTMRIILSGYTEVNTITEAINRGEVYKFLTKPWEDEQLRESIREAFVRYEQSNTGILNAGSDNRGELYVTAGADRDPS